MHHCRGPLHRRDLLRLGLLAPAGLTLPQVLGLREAAAAPGRPSDTSVILVFCHGGPSHLDTYDLKPDAPSEYRGPFRPIRTAAPGVEICELFPQQARVADRLALIRSVGHAKFDHQDGAQMFLTGRPPAAIKPKPDYPDFVAVTARLREEQSRRLPASIGVPPVEFSGPGFLGPSYAPFTVQGNPEAAQFVVPDLGRPDAAYQQRLARRARLRGTVDEMRRDLLDAPGVRATDRFYQRAVDMVTNREAAAAFDLSREPEPLREKYGRNRWGQSLLLARRLVEAGVSVVTVALYAVGDAVGHNWDDHSVNWHIFDAMKQRAPAYDQALAALIGDVYDRGLDRKTLIIATGEFGRTPKIEYTNGRPGRDHYAYAMSILVSGGGMRMGQVIGSTDSLGARPDDRPLTPGNFLETVYRHLGIDTAHEFTDHTGRPLRILDPAEPIRELG
jgi:uncharacterized protein (DUF1501 family)